MQAEPHDLPYPRFFTVDEVAAIFRLTPAAIRRMIRAKEFPAIKIGKEYRIPQQAIENILNPIRPENPTDAGFGMWKEKKLPRGEDWVHRTRQSDTRSLTEYLRDLDGE